jgi:chemotaxis protein methyltransferase CheR
MNMELTQDELNDILKVIKVQYGYDFTGYAEASLKRRLLRFCSIANVSVFDLRFHIVNEKPFFFWLLEMLTVNVTEMFRDPSFYKSLVANVLPALATYPHIRVWMAGCATGEEAYSMAILLHEADLLKRSRIYATDINMANIEKASSGILSQSHMKEYTANYLQAGGKRDFSDYYTASYDNVIISQQLRQNILFSQHNLVTDQVFNEFQLICCRNVLIYFKRPLQNSVVNLFYQSLSPLGFLALGTKESLIATECAAKFDVVNPEQKIFKLKRNEQAV